VLQGANFVIARRVRRQLEAATLAPTPSPDVPPECLYMHRGIEGKHVATRSQWTAHSRSGVLL
jgi:hypothetical protein